MNEDLHPYVIFLPPGQKMRILGAIFGSKAAVDILRFALGKGISHKIYQRDLIAELDYSNKTIIENLKSLTRLRVMHEDMEKVEKDKRAVWIKSYQLSDAGRWFALLLAEEKDLSGTEKAEILQDLFRSYVRWVKSISEKLKVSKKDLESIFTEEMK